MISVQNITKNITVPDISWKIGKIFDLIEQAYLAIEDGRTLYPDKADVIFNMFMPLEEQANIFWEYIPALFRAHCREIIDRIGKDVSKKGALQEGTYAECLIAVSKASLQTPLTNDGLVLYQQCWKKTFEKEPPIPPGMSPEDVRWELHESYEGAVKEEIIRLRKKIGTLRTIRYPVKKD